MDTTLKPWSILGLIVLLLLGAVVAFFAFFAGAFATDSGELDPQGMHFSRIILTVPPVYFFCVVATLVLMILRRGRLALLAALFPFVYFVGAFIYAAVIGDAL